MTTNHLPSPESNPRCPAAELAKLFLDPPDDLGDEIAVTDEIAVQCGPLEDWLGGLHHHGGISAELDRRLAAVRFEFSAEPDMLRAADVLEMAVREDPHGDGVGRARRRLRVALDACARQTLPPAAALVADGGLRPAAQQVATPERPPDAVPRKKKKPLAKERDEALLMRFGVDPKKIKPGAFYLVGPLDRTETNNAWCLATWKGQRLVARYAPERVGRLLQRVASAQSQGAQLLTRTDVEGTGTSDMSKLISDTNRLLRVLNVGVFRPYRRKAGGYPIAGLPAVECAPLP